jgi:hypothetical protein
MKTIFFILFIGICNSLYAQTTTDLNKFVGTWRWVSNTDTVIIILEKQNIQIYPGYSRVVIVGWHKYVKNGLLVESSMQYVGRDENLDHTSNDAIPKSTLRGHAKDTNTIWFTGCRDLTLNKNCYLFLYMLPNSTTQAKWTLQGTGGIYNGPPGTEGLYTLPREIILTKL